MYVITVIPITKSAPARELSYFGSVPLEIGMVVYAPVRGKKVPALVVRVARAEQEKASLRKKTFSLRSLGTQEGKRLFHPALLHTAEALQNQYAASIGSVLYALLPIGLLPTLHKRGTEYHDSNAEPLSKNRKNSIPPLEALEAPQEERIRSYAGVIRSAFAEGKSVFVCAPTIEEVEYIFERLRKGIEHRAFCLTSLEKPSALFMAWEDTVHAPLPVMVCGTPLFLSLPRNDFGYFILEREGARSYTLPQRPYLHVGRVIEALARAYGATLIRGDSVLSIETAIRSSEGDIEEREESTSSKLPSGATHIFSMKRDPEKPKETFSTIGKELQREIALLRQEGTPVFLLATRKGYATSVICRDCGSAVPCHACASPVTLRMKGGKRFLFCLRCRTSRSALETCGTCGSWNLIELGIGVERVYQEAEALFGKEAVLLFDATTAPTHKKAKQIIHAFEEKRKKGLAPVLVGTERAIHYLHHTPLYVGVVSLDSLLSIPEWKAHERAFALLTVLSEKASQIGIQTRRPEEPLLRFAMLGLRSDMRTEEITMRKKFKYPPVATLITITSVGEKKSVRVEGAKVRAYLESWNPIELYTEVSATRSKHTMILALPKEGLEKDTALRDKLLALPPAMAVRVNPESLWE